MADQGSDHGLVPGDVVAGRYRIEAPIGVGGYGAVFRAIHLGMNREVALKVLLPEVVRSPDGLARFRREAELAQQLEHPNTVRLLDFGIADGDTPFIAWELLRGRSLDAAIAEGPMAPLRVCRIGAQVCKSLMEAHEKGIVHRDVKPANVFLCEFSGERDFVKVLDFGIAKLVAGRQAEGDARLTRPGEAVGTPNYMAPEILVGGAATPSADLYALGLTLAEALAGRMVFPGLDAVDLVQRQIAPGPVPLPAEALASPLGPLLERATRKRPGERFASATEMVEQLEATARTLSSTIRRPRAAESAATQLAMPAATELAAPAKPRRRRWPLVLALFLGLAAIGAGAWGGVVAWRSREPAKPRSALRAATIEWLQERVAAEGWPVTSTTTSQSSSGWVLTAYFKKGQKEGFAVVYRCEVPADAARIEDAVRKQEAQCAAVRDGPALVKVCIEKDLAAAKHLAADIAR